MANNSVPTEADLERVRQHLRLVIPQLVEQVLRENQGESEHKGALLLEEAVAESSVRGNEGYSNRLIARAEGEPTSATATPG